MTDDDAVLDELARALRAQSEVPKDVVAAAKSIFTWRTVNAELAALTADSSVAEPSGVRGTGTVRSLSFAAGDSVVELDLAADGLTGLVLPPQLGRITIETAAGDGLIAVVDEFGGFRLPAPRERFRLRCELGGSMRLVTEWIEP